MDSDLEHIVLTRFNLPSAGAESVVRAQDGWLRRRVDLFERYCLPSVRAQSDQRFGWIVYVDPLSPGWFLDWMEAVSADGILQAVRREVVLRDDLLADIERLLGGRPEHLLTTNLDNDDGLAVDFVARVRDAPSPPGRSAIYVTHGLIADSTGVYGRSDRHNAFCSVREPWVDAVTCWSDWHNRLPLHMPVVEVGGDPGWLQVIHGTNVSNRVRGRRISPSTYRSRFPGLLDDLPDPSRATLLGDRLLHGPRRAVRETARAGVKHAATAVLGRDGLDRAKGTWASLRAPRTG